MYDANQAPPAQIKHTIPRPVHWFFCLVLKLSHCSHGPQVRSGRGGGNDGVSGRVGVRGGCDEGISIITSSGGDPGLEGLEVGLEVGLEDCLEDGRGGGRG